MLLALLMTGIALFCNTAAGDTPAAAILVDGMDNDWTDSMVIYNKDLDGMMGVAFDDSSLILMFRFGNEELTRKVMFGGATLWWHHQGKKKKEYGIKFPIQRPQPGARPERLESADEQDAGRRRNMAAPSFPIELISPVFCIKKTGEKLPWKDVAGIAASAGNNKEAFCFEFRIPLLPDNPYALVSKPGKKVRICLELGEKVARSSMRPPMDGGGRGARMGGGMGGGGGMRPGGGMGGPEGRPGSPGGGQLDMLSVFEPHEEWVTVQLP